MKKFILLLSLIATGCEDGVSEEVTSNGGTEVHGSGGGCTVYVVEKDGYKFAVAVGHYKCGITQIIEQ